MSMARPRLMNSPSCPSRCGSEPMRGSPGVRRFHRSPGLHEGPAAPAPRAHSSSARVRIPAVTEFAGSPRLREGQFRKAAACGRVSETPCADAGLEPQGLRPCNVVRLRRTAPLRSRLRSEPRASASGSSIAPNLAVRVLGAVCRTRNRVPSFSVPTRNSGAASGVWRLVFRTDPVSHSPLLIDGSGHTRSPAVDGNRQRTQTLRRVDTNKS